MGGNGGVPVKSSLVIRRQTALKAVHFAKRDPLKVNTKAARFEIRPFIGCVGEGFS